MKTKTKYLKRGIQITCVSVIIEPTDTLNGVRVRVRVRVRVGVRVRVWYDKTKTRLRQG